MFLMTKRVGEAWDKLKLALFEGEESLIAQRQLRDRSKSVPVLILDTQLIPLTNHSPSIT